MKKPIPRLDVIFYAALVILSLVGMLALGWSTRFGLGLSNDSASYVNGAENLRLGHGYTRTSGAGELKAITHFPPFYSLLIAMLTLPGLNLLQTAHLINLVLFSLDILLVGCLVYQISQSRLFSLFSALLLALSDSFLGIYAMLLSEALFITLMLALFLALGQFIHRRSSGWLFTCGVLAGLAYLTRFAGVSLFVTILIFLLGIAPTIKVYLKHSLVFLVGGFPFVSGWILSNLRYGNNIGNRVISIHLPTLHKVFEALKNLLSWAALDDFMNAQRIFGWALSALSLLLFPALVAWVARWFWITKTRKEAINSGVSLSVGLGLHILVYFAFLLVTISFFDASTTLDDRILSIIFIPQLVLFSSGLGSLSGILDNKSKWLRAAFTAVCLTFLIFSGLDGVREAEQLGRDGLGFNHSGWKNSQTIQFVRAMPPAILYSNRPTAIYLLTGKSSYIVPTAVDPVTTQDRSTYRSDLETMHGQILAGKAILILFQGSNNGEVEENTAALTQGLELIADFNEADIYGKP